MKLLSMHTVLAAAAVLVTLTAGGGAFAADEATNGESSAMPALKDGATLDASTPVAVVNGSPIRKGEFDRAMQGYIRQFQQMSGGMHGGVGAPNPQMQADVLEQLVDRELLYQESMKNPLANPQEMVDQEFDNLSKRFPSGEEMDKALAEQGLTRDELRDLLVRQVQVRNYLEKEIVPTVSVSDEDVRKFYDENLEKFATPEQVRCSHILIRVDPNANEGDRKSALEKTQDLRARCVKGESFEDLAKEFSQDPGSAGQGGDLGFFTRERMVTPFADAAFGLQAGEISDVVETRFGYHIIKMAERKEAGQQGFEEVKGPIENFLRNQALDTAVRAKVDKLRETATIDVMAPHL